MTEPRFTALEALADGRFDQAAAAALVGINVELVKLRMALEGIDHHLGVIAVNLDDPAAARP